MNRRLGLVFLAIVAVGALVWSRREGEPHNAKATGIDGASSGTAKIVVEQSTFDFGTMEVGEFKRHAFVVRNEGTAPLTVKLQSTTCKCTLAEIGNEVVAPGESTQIELEWQTEHRQENYRHGARLSTNDPQSKYVDLAVEGRVRTTFGVWPETVHFGDIDRNKESQMDHLTIFSQVYPELKIKSVTSSNPDAQVELIDPPADPQVPEKTLFTRGMRIRYRAGAKSGNVQGVVRVVYEVPNAEANAAREQAFEFVFTGTVVGDLALHGRDVVGRAVLLGTVLQHTGVKHTVYIHARNGIGEGLDLSVGEVKPEFLQVRVGARQKLSEKVSRYPIELEIPPGSPEVNMTNVDPGKVQILTTHPDYPAVKFDVSMAVVR